jgi:hypothetical protein
MPRYFGPLSLMLVAAALAGCFGGRPAPLPRETAEQCLANLKEHGIIVRLAELRAPPDQRCQIEAPLKVSRIEIAFNRPATMGCRLAERIDAFERLALQQLALRDLGQPVVRVEQLGAYSCRASTGNHDQLSEHAYGAAIDISGFRLSDGSAVSVEHDWWTPGPKRDFLHHLAHDACGFFSVVLTPSSNRDHFDHIHLDIGPDRLCSV